MKVDVLGVVLVVEAWSTGGARSPCASGTTTRREPAPRRYYAFLGSECRELLDHVTQPMTSAPGARCAWPRGSSTGCPSGGAGPPTLTRRRSGGFTCDGEHQRGAPRIVGQRQPRRAYWKGRRPRMLAIDGGGALEEARRSQHMLTSISVWRLSNYRRWLVSTCARDR